VNLARLLLRLALGRRLPRASGTIALPGLADEILIRRDRYGIPHIEARGDEDGAFAIGFCQGQDRAFQLELLLRLARGTVAELVGPAALPIDRLARRIGFARGADEQLAASPAELAAVVGAYARGVSAGGRAGLRRKPHEFVLLRTQPSAWEGVDVVAVNRLIAFLIPSNWDAELARLKVLAEDGPEALLALDGATDQRLPTIVSGAIEPSVDRLAGEIELLTGVAGIGGASNSWVLSGARTATGRPLLANDPHLAPTLPPHWYLVHVRTGDWELAGASYVGTPVVLTGLNGFGAWGVTAALTDNTDLFVERLDEAGTIRERLVETIHVRGGAPVREEVLVTANGPVISPALEGVSHAISLCATWLEPRPIVGFLRAFKARSFEEFRRSFEHWPAVPLNLVWADASGTIGWQLVGDTPRRLQGAGLVPRPGWEESARWATDCLPFDELPFLADPQDGVIATANNKPLPEGAGHHLGADWIDGYRAARILELLAGRDDWDVASTLHMHKDVASLPWRELAEIVLATPVTDADALAARELLRAWDGDVAADSAGATVYVFLAAELVRREVAACAPRSAAWAAGKGFHMLLPTTMYGRRRLGRLASRLRERGDALEIAEALEATGRGLRERFGDDPAGWAWGRVRPLVLHHPLGLRRPLGRIFDLGPYPLGGDAATIAQAPVETADPAGPPSVVPSLRAVIDVGDWDACRWSMPGGQSGNPLSPHYADLLTFFLDGQGVPIAWSPEAVRAATVTALRLRPAGAN
jgi:penicillin G amidase